MYSGLSTWSIFFVSRERNSKIQMKVTFFFPLKTFMSVFDCAKAGNCLSFVRVYNVLLGVNSWALAIRIIFLIVFACTSVLMAMRRRRLCCQAISSRPSKLCCWLKNHATQLRFPNPIRMSMSAPVTNNWHDNDVSSRRPLVNLSFDGASIMSRLF